VLTGYPELTQNSNSVISIMSLGFGGVGWEMETRDKSGHEFGVVVCICEVGAFSEEDEIMTEFG
jgi:hypothetical protein